MKCGGCAQPSVQRMGRDRASGVHAKGRRDMGRANTERIIAWISWRLMPLSRTRCWTWGWEQWERGGNIRDRMGEAEEDGVPAQDQRRGQAEAVHKRDWELLGSVHKLVEWRMRCSP